MDVVRGTGATVCVGETICCEANEGVFAAVVDTIFRGCGTGTALGTLVGRCCGFVKMFETWDTFWGYEFCVVENDEHAIGIAGVEEGGAVEH